jgi:uncharacterized membrane protein YfcA
MARKLKTCAIALISAASGLINSLLGAGGGILLSLTLPALTKESFHDRRDVYVNAQAAMIPGCALSCLIYSMRGMVDTVGFSLLAIPAAAGGALGSILLSKIKCEAIQIIFSLLVIWSGIKMIGA